MSLLRTSLTPLKLIRKNIANIIATRNHFYPHYKPGPYPKDECDCLRAARKYLMHELEYEPYPRDGMDLGDYPTCEPAISGDVRDPFYPWDNPEHKRCFQETIYADIDMIDETKYNISAVHWPSPAEQFIQFIVVVGGFWAIFYWLESCKMFPVRFAKEFPENDKKYYTFEFMSNEERAAAHKKAEEDAKAKLRAEKAKSRGSGSDACAKKEEPEK